MGRAGIEPATLGLKVRLDELQRAARDGNVLHLARSDSATNCNKLQVAETSLYAHPYAHFVWVRQGLGGRLCRQIFRGRGSVGQLRFPPVDRDDPHREFE